MKLKLFGLCVVFCFTGCTTNRYPNWESVKVVRDIPDGDCLYVAQEICRQDEVSCFNWLKKRATLFAANTVYLSQENSVKEKVKTIDSDKEGTSYRFESKWVYTVVGDYYQCTLK